MTFNFNPSLPTNHKKSDKYFDTSVVRIILLGKFGNSILSDLAIYKGKSLISDHVKYEFKRAILVPIWELYWSLDEVSDVNQAIINSSQAFSQRVPKALLQILGNLTCGADVPKEVYKTQLLELAKKLDSDLEKVFETISNKTGCSLGNIDFKIDIDFPEEMKCKEKCNVDAFWKGKKSNILTLKTSSYTAPKSKTWHNEIKEDLELLLQDFNHGKNSKTCMKLSDILVFLYSKKSSTVLVSLDHSFEAINSVLGYSFHQVSSVSSASGGSTPTIAKNAFLKSRNNKK